MNNQIFFIIIIILIFVYYLPNYYANSTNSIKNKYKEVPQQLNITSQNLINEYLNENMCKENFNTMGKNTNIGNDMDFKQDELTKNISPLSKSLSKSLVPDFQPNSININPNLNSYGYTTTNSQADKYYKSRGYIEPEKGKEYADFIAYNLE